MRRNTNPFEGLGIVIAELVLVASLWSITGIGSVPPLNWRGLSEQTTQTFDDGYNFKLVSSGRLTRKGIVSGDFSLFKARDGVTVEMRIETFHSQAEAVKELEYLKKNAAHASTAAPIADAEKQRSDRVILIGLEGSKTDFVTIAWTTKANLYLVMSHSKVHALAFEKQRFQ